MKAFRVFVLAIGAFLGPSLAMANMPAESAKRPLKVDVQDSKVSLAPAEKAPSRIAGEAV